MPVKLRKGSGIYYTDFWVEDKRYRISTGTGNKLEAQRTENKLLADILKGQPAVKLAAGFPLADAFDKSFRTTWKDLKSQSTYLILAKRLRRELGDNLQVKDITTKKVAELRESLESQGMHPSTINRHMAVLSSLLNICLKKWECIDRLPAFQFDRERNGRMYVFSQADERTILDAADLEMQQLITVLAYTGMRLGEALSMEWQDVDLKQGVIKLWDTKNGDSRAVPMLSNVKVILESIPKTDSPRVFPHNRFHYRLRWDQLRVKLGKQDDPGFIMHTWRHTCATRLVEAGVPLYTVKEWLGHRSIETTIRYAKMTGVQLTSGAALMESALRPLTNLKVVTQ